MNLELTLNVPERPVLAGESLPVVLKLVNKGQAAVAAPAPRSNPFEISLQSLNDPAVRYSLSADQVRSPGSDDQLPTRAPRIAPLEPGAMREYRLDVAALAPTALVPARYRIVAHYAAARDVPAIASNEREIQVLALRVQSLLVLLVPEPPGVAELMVHKEEDGPARLLLRQGRFGDPPHPPFHGLANDIDAVPGRVALAAGGESMPARWAVWLQGGRLQGSLAGGPGVYSRLDGLDLGLREPMLASLGQQIDRETARFAALGTRADGRAALAMVRLDAAHPAQVETFALAGAVPQRWLPLYQRGPDSGVALLTADAAGSVPTRVTLSPGRAGSFGAPALLIERAEPLAAWTLGTPVSGTGDAVDLLFGPKAGGLRMTWLRQPLGAGPPTAAFEFDVPRDGAGRPPSGWALANDAERGPVAVARLGDQIVGRWLSPGGRGFVVANQAGQAQFLQVLAFPGVLWVAWADPRLGLRRVVLR